jgi:hypothetical protein
MANSPMILANLVISNVLKSDGRILPNLCYTLVAPSFDLAQEEHAFWEIVLIIPNDGPAK